MPKRSEFISLTLGLVGHCVSSAFQQQLVQRVGDEGWAERPLAAHAGATRSDQAGAWPQLYFQEQRAPWMRGAEQNETGAGTISGSVRHRLFQVAFRIGT